MAGRSGRIQLVVLLLVALALLASSDVPLSAGSNAAASSMLWLSKLGSVDVAASSPEGNAGNITATPSMDSGPLASNTTDGQSAPIKRSARDDGAGWTLVEWYDEMVRRHPYPTKSLTSATIGFVGDALAQGIEQWLSNAQPYDARRALSVAISEGIAGPGLHICYATVEGWFPTVGLVGLLSRVSTAFLHWLFDTFLFDAIFIVNAFVCTGVLEGKRLIKDIVPQVALEFVPTMRASVFTGICLSPLELCVFTFVAPAYRVLAINCNDVVWNAIVSFFAHRERRRQKQQENKAATKKAR